MPNKVKNIKPGKKEGCVNAKKEPVIVMSRSLINFVDVVKEKKIKRTRDLITL